jgi:hypothetical protein
VQDRDRPVELLLRSWRAGGREMHVAERGAGPTMRVLLAGDRRRWQKQQPHAARESR